MISRRSKRYSQPQESLRQFSLNSSKGWDASKPVTDPNTVYDMDNLIVNPDGSLSLRKPITTRSDIPTSILKGARMFRETHDPSLYIAVYDDRLEMYEYDGVRTFTKIQFTVSVDAYDDSFSTTYKADCLDEDGDGAAEIKDEYGVTKLKVIGYNLSELEICVLGTATILSNVRITNKIEGVSGVGRAFPENSEVYRYLQITKKTLVESPLVECKIINPTHSSTVHASSGTSVDLDLLLDNPYVFRDDFYATSPKVNGMYYYSMSSRYGNYIYPLGTSANYIDMLKLTDALSPNAYRPMESVKLPYDYSVIRAFVSIPNYTVYAAWFATDDGVNWKCITPELDGAREVPEPKDTEFESAGTSRYVPLDYLKSSDLEDITAFSTASTESGEGIMVPETAVAIPVLALPEPYKYRAHMMYVLRLVSLRKKPVEGSTTTEYEIALEYNRGIFTMPRGDANSYMYSELDNASRGSKLYHNSRIYSYGHPGFKNNILATNPNEFTTPYSNVIDVSEKAGEYVTTLTPWREYLVSSTQSAMFLHTPVEGGWLTKAITTGIGIPKVNSKCCVTTLNSIMLKSGCKVYQLYPNLYSGTDSILTVSDMSTPIEEFLIEHPGDERQFAFTTDSEYILMIPDTGITHCLRYNYTKKSWTRYSYPVEFYDVSIKAVDDIRLFGHSGDIHVECVFDDSVNTSFGTLEDPMAGIYGDVIIDEDGNLVRVPINFLYDTGQKTDAISVSRQFVESKLMFATLDDADTFPFTLHIAIDGDPHIIRKDVSTDAPFWKSEDNLSRGVLGTAFTLTTDTVNPASGTFNTLRQLVVRYSGKGKSIRHVVEGKSYYNFKLYETHVRYKLLSAK